MKKKTVKRDYTRARAVLEFLEKECGLTILPWIRKFVRAVYVTNGETGLRICTRALLSMGRKNGKSHLAAALLLCHLVGPESHYHPAGTEIASVAGSSKDQASIIYDSMVAIIESNTAMKQMLTITRGTISHNKLKSYYTYRPTTTRGAHGLRSAVWVFDELAQAKDSSLLDALDRAQGVLEEGLGFIVSTNSTRPGQPMAELISAVKRAKSKGKMKHWVCHVYAADPDAVEKDPLAMKHVHDANPSYGTILKKSRVRTERIEAENIPSKMTYYRSYRLNLDADELGAFLDINKWRKCADPSLTLESMEGRDCIVAVDLSLSTSLSSVAYWFPDDMENPIDGGSMIVENWIPHGLIGELSEKHSADYRGWERAGLVRTTEGSTIDLDTIVDRLIEVEKMVNITDVRRDAARVRELESKLSQRDTNLTARFVRQGFISMGPASDSFIKVVTNGRLKHNDNPVTNMCLRNTAARQDHGSTSQQVKPDRLIKEHPIDATVAMVECLMFLEPPERRDDWLCL